MSPILPDADPAGLPAPVALLKLLLVALLPLHLVAMNLALGGGLLAAWAAWRRRRRAELESGRLDGLRRTLTTTLLVSTAAAITLGVAPLLFLQVVYGQLFYTSSILMAWWWLAVVALLMAGYYSYYAFAFRQRVGAAGSLFALAGSLLLVVVAFLFTNNMTLMLRPDRFGALYAASDAGLHTNLGDGWVWPRFLHVAVGSLAVTGIVIGLVGRLRTWGDPSIGLWVTAFGARLFILATLVQLAVGVWFLFSLPHVVRDVVLTGGPELMLLATGVGFALLALFVVRRSVVLAAVPLVVTIVDMVIVRHQVRKLTLVPYFSVDSMAVNAQTGVFVLFAVLLVAGLAVVAWMVWRLAATRPAVTAE